MGTARPGVLNVNVCQARDASVLAMLRESNGPCTTDAIAGRLGLRKDRAYEALARLADLGEIVQIPKARGQAVALWRLPTTEEMVA
jgi:predicted transcriptional regulator